MFTLRDFRLTVCSAGSLKLLDPHETLQDAVVMPCYVDGHTQRWNGIINIKCKFLFANPVHELHHTTYRMCA